MVPPHTRFSLQGEYPWDFVGSLTVYALVATIRKELGILLSLHAVPLVSR